MRYYLLASGSKGNCCVIIGESTQIVIDCGSTKRHLVASFKDINIDYRQIDALLLTHAHNDHISQVKMFIDTKIYAPFNLVDIKHSSVIPFEKFKVKEFEITPLALSHDCDITLGYIIENKHEKLVYITDTGYLRQDYYDLIANADYYVLESNHDVKMLMASNRPYPLKRRIISDNGHLDNESCADILVKVRGKKTKEIVLAHLSEVANTPDLAYETIRKKVKDEKITVKVSGQYKIVEGGQ